MGLFGIDAQKTSQTSTQQQVGVQGGVGYGGVSGNRNVGGGSTGNITSPITVSGKGGSVSISSSNPEVAEAAIGGNTTLGLAVLESNRDLATQAINYAGANTQTALSLLGAQLSTPGVNVSVGGSPGPIGSVPYDGGQSPYAPGDGGVSPGGIDSKTLLWIGAIIAGVFIIVNMNK